MKPQPDVIELEIPKLESLLETIQAVLGEEVSGPFRQLLDSHMQLLEIIRAQQLSMRKLQQLVFGAKTETTRNVLGAESTSFPDPAATGQDQEAEQDTSSSAVGSADGEGDEQDEGGRKRGRRKGHGRKPAAAYWGCLKVAVPHEWLSGGDACPTCQDGTLYALRDPRPLVRLVGQAPVGGTLYEMERLRCHLCGQVFTAEPPEGIGDEKYDPSVAAMLALLRYGYGMPSNRLAELQQLTGVPLAASTQWEVVRDHAYSIVPVFDYLILQGAQGEVVHNDDTPMRILELMDKKTRRQALREEEPDRCGIFTTNILSISQGHSIGLFFTGPQHAGENLRDVLARRAEELPPPIQMCDALSRNVPKDLSVILANCLTHSRRRFADVVEAFEGPVTYVLHALKKVYQVDAEARTEELSPQDRLHLHQQRSGPVMQELHDWLNEQFDQKKVEPNSSLGDAIRFMLKHWNKLTLFLREPGAPLDNNICERALKKAIRHRRNSLFYRSRRGAFVGDLFMSLIHTCFLSFADPFDYLTQLLRHHEQAARNPADWMPWNYRAQLAAVGSFAEGKPTNGPAPPATAPVGPVEVGEPAPFDTS